MEADFKKTSDEELLELASDPVRPLLGVFARADSMTPLVLLFALLPALVALEDRPLTDGSARWNLRALDISMAGSFSEILDPGSRFTSADETPSLRWQPPLLSWLTAGCLKIFGRTADFSMLIVPILGTVGLVLVVYLLASCLLGSRCGLLTAAFLGCHGFPLAILQENSPHNLGLLFAAGTIWLFVIHERRAAAVLSPKMMLSGMSAGLCLLCSGPLVIATIGILLLYVLCRDVHQCEETDGATGLERNALLLGILVLGFTAFAVGGWWELMMARHGSEFWWGWFGFDSVEEGSTHSTGYSDTVVLPGIGNLLMGLLALTGYGGWRAFAIARTDPSVQQRRSVRLLLVWTVAATCIWQFWQRGPAEVSSVNSELWTGFALIPMLVLAGFGTSQIIERPATLETIIGVGVLTAANLIWQIADGSWSSLPVRTTVVCLFLAVLLVGVFLRQRRGFAQPQGRGTRVVVGSLVAVIVFSGWLSNWHWVRRSTADDAELASLREKLLLVERVERYTMITSLPPDEIPPQLQLTLKRMWPNVRGESRMSWQSALPDDASRPRHETGVWVFLVWETTQPPIPDVQKLGATLTLEPPIEYFQHKQLATYVLSSAPL